MKLFLASRRACSFLAHDVHSANSSLRQLLSSEAIIDIDHEGNAMHLPECNLQNSVVHTAAASGLPQGSEVANEAAVPSAAADSDAAVAGVRISSLLQKAAEQAMQAGAPPPRPLAYLVLLHAQCSGCRYLSSSPLIWHRGPPMLGLHG